MQDITKDNNGIMGVEFRRLAAAVWSRLWLVVLSAILCAVIAFAGTFFLVTPLYQASTMFYVNNSDFSLGGTSVSIGSSDITASKSLVESYIVILQTRETMTEIIDFAGVDRSYEALCGMISAQPVDATEIFRVTVTSPDPVEAEQIADAVAYVLPERIRTIIDGTSAKIVDYPVVPTRPSSPSYAQNLMIGFILGITLSISIIVLREVFDVKIRTEEDITQNCACPVLASIPDMQTRCPGKGTPRTAGAGPGPVGSGVSFAAAEAYKLLRTKLQFSFTDDKGCRVLGVSSAMAGEGKSLTAVNLAYALSELNKRVLLIDCDMRRPSLTANLPNVSQTPGLSDYLSGQADFEGLIQPCGIENREDAFGAITAGRNPPNPGELLSSARMSRLLERLRGEYDFVVLDFPPVEEVSDPLAVAKQTDGMLLVARQDFCNRVAFATAVRQFEFVGARLLGVVYNCVCQDSGTYGKGYRKGYTRGYAGRHAPSRGGRRSALSQTRKNKE